MLEIGKKMMSQSKFYMGYSRWLEDKNKYETWEEAVERVMNMHREKYAHVMSPKLDEAMKFAEEAYKEQLVLGAQRALQFGGEQIFKHEARMYNCSVSYVDRPRFFSEAFYLLLCGVGTGFSVQRHHIDKLPAIARRSAKRVKVYKIADSIEGWADSVAVLLSSYFTERGQFPEYKGCQVHFDFSDIRPRGAYISGGFKAPGPDGLRKTLIKIEELLENYLKDEPVLKMNSITAYDLVMHISDAVLSGGVRRSATICMFDKDDKDMLTAKTGDWRITNPQRSRSNNSAVLIRDELSREEWKNIVSNTKQFGEPGFIFSSSREHMYNPCVEVGMLPRAEDGESGWQFCNLTEKNGLKLVDRATMLRAARAGAILGTLQAGYTNFKYLTDASRRITERESLIGVGITGWMNNPDITFDEQNMRDAARLVLETNKEIAALIGINPAARGTVVKPSGNASTILGCTSGIHGGHAPLYIRNVQMTDNDEVARKIREFNPKMVERSVYSNTDVIVSFPIEMNPSAIFNRDLLGVKQLEYVKKAQQNWIEYGTDVSLCVDPTLRHNVSNTITVDDWDEVEEYIYNNREWFAGISLMSGYGDKGFPQSPFTEVFTAEQIFEQYGSGALYASGLIVDGLHAFNNNLWNACDTVLGHGEKLDGDDSEELLKRDWVRRAKKFADNYFDGDIIKMTFCLKDCYNRHKWDGIVRDMKEIDFSTALGRQEFVDADTLAGAACAGSACEITF